VFDIKSHQEQQMEAQVRPAVLFRDVKSGIERLRA